MTAPLTEHAFNQRRDSLLSLLDRIGEARLDDVGALDPERVITISANAPLDEPFQTAFFQYQEIYARLPNGTWLLRDYYYEFQRRSPPGRRAHHRHEPYDYHQHCCDPRFPARDHHYVGGAIDVYDAHREFLQWYARNAPVDCAGLTPLFP